MICLLAGSGGFVGRLILSGCVCFGMDLLCLLVEGLWVLVLILVDRLLCRWYFVCWLLFVFDAVGKVLIVLFCFCYWAVLFVRVVRWLVCLGYCVICCVLLSGSACFDFGIIKMVVVLMWVWLNLVLVVICLF